MSNRKIENGSLEWTFTAYRDGINPAKGIIMNLEGDTVSIPEEQIFFLDGYLITIFNEFVPDIEKRDIIMAAFGLLNGYCDIHDPRNRHEKYCQIVGIHKGNKDIRLCDHWSDIHKNLNSKENAIIIKMCEFLRTELNNNNGKLGYIEKAKYMAQKLKKESYPSPYYMRGDIYYRECKLDGNTFYIPKSESERRSDEILKSKNVNEQVIIQTVDNEKYSEPKTFNVDKPDLVDLVKADADKSGVFFPPEPEDEIAKYIRKTQTASYHDEFSHEIYAALCHEGESPYSEWVATWLLKCIRECFENRIETDILLASFALPPGYHLVGYTVKERLRQYIHNSDCLTICPNKPDSYTGDIENENIICNLEPQIEKMERKCVEELITYIKNIINPTKHIEELNDYGFKENLSNNKIAFKPNPKWLKLNYSERKNDKNSNYSKNIIHITHSQSSSKAKKVQSKPNYIKRTIIYFVILVIAPILISLVSSFATNNNSLSTESKSNFLKKQVTNELEDKTEFSNKSEDKIEIEFTSEGFSFKGKFDTIDDAIKYTEKLQNIFER